MQVAPPPATTTVAVPDVTGLSRSAAVTAIVNAGLRVGFVSEIFSDEDPANTVLAQDPDAGTSVQRGGLVHLFISLGPEPGSFTAPNVVNMTQSAAEGAIEDAGLTVGSVTQAFSSTVPDGRVISQNPVGGTSVQRDSSVHLLISLGPEPGFFTVPNVVNMTQSAAEGAIEDAGLTVGSVTQAFSSTVAAGRVISQNPVGGTSVSEGASVSLVISRGPQQPTVPNLLGLTRSAAESAISLAELNVGNVTEEYSSTVLSGLVIRQNPAAGASVSSGSAVTFVVSLGPQPIAISTLSDLQKIGSDPNFPLDGNYLLTADINAAPAASSNGGLGFAPIGNSLSRFTGRFDGQGHSITSLAMNRPSQDYVGLFGYAAAPAVITNLSVVNVAITGDEYIGGIIGFCQGGVVSDCDVTGALLGERRVGGLVGNNFGGEVARCTADVSITVSSVTGGGLIGYNSGSVSNCESMGVATGGNYIGGLIGASEGGSVSESSSTAAVDGDNNCGGLIGSNEGTVSMCAAVGQVVGYRAIGGLIGQHEGLVDQCLATGSVEGTFDVGGLVGLNGRDSTISSSYALGSAMGSAWIGGLVGQNETGALIFDCYSVGRVLSSYPTNPVGGLVADNDGTVAGSFWDKQTSGLTESAGGTGLNTVQMQTATQFVGAGWDFVNIWGIVEGASYPFLLWAVEE